MAFSSSHLPLDAAHEPVQALLPLLWGQSGVRGQVPHDVKVTTHPVGQTWHTGILFISSDLTEQVLSSPDGTTKAPKPRPD